MLSHHIASLNHNTADDISPSHLRDKITMTKHGAIEVTIYPAFFAPGSNYEARILQNA